MTDLRIAAQARSSKATPVNRTKPRYQIKNREIVWASVAINAQSYNPKCSDFNIFNFQIALIAAQ